MDQKFHYWPYTEGPCRRYVLGILGGLLYMVSLFLLYTADVLVIAARHDVGVHSYADDTQL